VTVRSDAGHDIDIGYDIIAVTTGAVTRRLPIPGVAERAIGLKNVEEAIAIRDQLLVNFDRASVLETGPERRRLLTVTVVGGGFTGVEGFAELFSLARSLLSRYPEITAEEIDFRLVEAQDRILPEVSRRTADWAARWLEVRGARIHLRAQLLSASHGHVVLSTGEEFDSDLIVWTAGNAATEVVAKHTDLPIDGRGLITVRADLRVAVDGSVVPQAWAAGDDAAVPDLASKRSGARAAPTAQHAVRQGRRLGVNIARSIHGRAPKSYLHHNLGAVATLGLGHGVFQSGPVVIKGFPAWLMHRGYHVLAVPTWERKVRVLAVWLTAAIFGRDIVSLRAVQHPRDAFVGKEPDGHSGTAARFEVAEPATDPGLQPV
jgi:NADH dehydrogenase